MLKGKWVSRIRGPWWMILLIAILLVVGGGSLWVATHTSSISASPASAAQGVQQLSMGGASGRQGEQTAWAASLVSELTVAEITPTPPPSSDNCVTCHTDKARLQELAEEPEKVKSELASGEG